jgi:non-lysosomal glucosylceramidase
MVYRDYVLTGRQDKEFLREYWPAMRGAIEYLRQFDHGGGVPENSGYPDQTYDDWVVSGVSAYSGGLWLAALRAGEETARIVGDVKTSSEYHALFLKGQKTYVTHCGTESISATTQAASPKMIFRRTSLLDSVTGI